MVYHLLQLQMQEWNTATRVIDRAILDRFSLIEMDVLSEDDEYTLLKGKFPTIDENVLLQLCSIVGDIRKEINTGRS